MEDLPVHRWDEGGRVTTFTWLGERNVRVDRVYSIAFVTDGRLLLVGDESGRFWLAGGGVETGETPEAALRRELREEAAATVCSSQFLGVQRAERLDTVPQYHAFFWSRIELAPEFDPEHEITERRLVSADEFLDVLFWGRADPKARLLLDRAAALDRSAGPSPSIG